MHIAFFNRSFYPDTTATGQLLTELCEQLVEAHGCSVTVVAGLPLSTDIGNGGCISDKSPRGLVQREWYQAINILRARGTRFSKRRFAGRFGNYVSYFLSACYAGLRVGRPDIVVAQTDPPIIGLAGYLAARRFGAPFVMAYKDVFPEVGRLLDDFRSAAVDRMLQRVNCFLVRKADRVVVIGETMRQMLIEGKGADPAKTIVIPDWADCTAITPGPKVNAFSRVHGLTEKFVVMHSGNIGLSQELEVLVDAAADLRHLPDLEVVFVGEGVKKPALQERAERLGVKNVRFLPFTPKARLHESFAAADVFVVSLKSGLAGYIVPSKLYGILAAGRPYVAAVEDASEVAAITRRYGCGLVVPPGKSGELADQILNLYYNRPLATRMGVNARWAALEFDRPRQVQAYYDLFRSLTRTP
jgi:glycosyltransferase involved in cell wall biosynthesis